VGTLGRGPATAPTGHPVTRVAGLCLTLPTLLTAFILCGCGGDEGRRTEPADRVRDAARAYLSALEARDWTRTCGLLTASARREIAAAADARCRRALAGGAALPPEQAATGRREVAGAEVRIRGAEATIGPLGGLPRPLRLRRVQGRWLIAG
jgi:hypothetical protein